MKRFRNSKLLVLAVAIMLLVSVVPAYAGGPSIQSTSCSRWFGGSGDIHDYLWCFLIAYADYFCDAVSAW
jgi:hypothetical protein